MELIIDYRERALSLSLKKENMAFREDNLEVGDIQIYKDGVLYLAIERKTVSDYISSIRDKRLKNQIARLDKLKESQPQSSFLILIEGSFQPSFGQVVNISDFIYNSILNRVLTDKIPVIRSDNITETVTWIKKIIHKIEHDLQNSSSFIQSSSHYLSTLSIKKRDNLDQKNCFLLQLAQIPRVSIVVAQSIASYYPSLPALLCSYQSLDRTKDREQMLSEIKVGSRCLGKALSSKIYYSLFPVKTKIVLYRKTDNH